MSSTKLTIIICQLVCKESKVKILVQLRCLYTFNAAVVMRRLLIGSDEISSRISEAMALGSSNYEVIWSQCDLVLSSSPWWHTTYCQCGNIGLGG